MVQIERDLYFEPKSLRELAVDSPTPDEKPVEPLTQDQVNRFLEAAKNDRLYAYYVVCLGCGLRRGDA